MKKYEMLIVMLLTIGFLAWHNMPGKHIQFRIKKESTGSGTIVQQDTINQTQSVTGLKVRTDDTATDGLLSDTLIFITGTGSVKTRVYKSNPSMTFRCIMTDTSASDSVDIDIILNRASRGGNRIPNYAEFTVEGTLNFTTGAAWTTKVYTAAGSNRSNAELWYATIEGNADNKTLSAVECRCIFEGYEPNPATR